MKTKESTLKAIRKYKQAKVRRIPFDFNIEKEKDVLDKLDSTPNKKQYIVGLIREDMNENDDNEC